MMFNEDISSKKSFQHKKYIINRCTFILMLFMINVTIDLFYYYDYVNMYGSLLFSHCQYLSFPLQSSLFFFVFFFIKQDVFICPIELHFRFPPNLFLAIVYTQLVEMCHTHYSTWLYMYIFLIDRNVNK